MRTFASLMIVALALGGCAGGEARDEDAAPAQAPDFTGRHFEAAAKDLARKVAETSAAGWPAGVPLSSEHPARPVVRVGQLLNRSPRHVDMGRLEELVMEELLATGAVKVLAKGVLSTDGPVMELEGALDESVEGIGDSVTRDTTISLRLVNPPDRAVVLSSRSQFRTVSER